MCFKVCAILDLVNTWIQVHILLRVGMGFLSPTISLHSPSCLYFFAMGWSPVQTEELKILWSNWTSPGLSLWMRTRYFYFKLWILSRRRYLNPQKKRWYQEDGQNYLMMRSISCSHHLMLVGTYGMNGVNAKLMYNLYKKTSREETAWET
jgi:hypothetical protein